MSQLLNTGILLLIFSSFIYAQDLFVPRNIITAYQKGTRSVEGKPGPNYWQNEISYIISAEIEPSKRVLTGSETIKFKNNSPVLSIVLHSGCIIG
jgi:hypothetical protein